MDTLNCSKEYIVKMMTSYVGDYLIPYLENMTNANGKEEETSVDEFNRMLALFIKPELKICICHNHFVLKIFWWHVVAPWFY